MGDAFLFADACQRVCHLCSAVVNFADLIDLGYRGGL